MSTKVLRVEPEVEQSPRSCCRLHARHDATDTLPLQQPASPAGAAGDTGFSRTLQSPSGRDTSPHEKVLSPDMGIYASARRLARFGQARCAEVAPGEFIQPKSLPGKR